MDEQIPPNFPLESFPKKKTGRWIIFAAVIVFLLLAGGALAYYIYHQNIPISPTDNSRNPVVVVTSTPITVQTGSSFSCKNPLPPIASKSGQVEWINPEFLNTTIFASTGDPNNSMFGHEEDYLVGHILNGTYAGGDILVVMVYFNEPGGPSTNWVVKNGSQYYFLTKYGPAFPDLANQQMKTLVSITRDSSYFPADIDKAFFSAIHLSSPSADFTLVSSGPWAQTFFCADNLTKVFTDPAAGDVYTDAVLNTKDSYGNSVQTQQGFYVKAADGTVETYQLDIPITGKDNVPLVTWSNGSKNTLEYSYQQIGGCGPGDYRDVADVSLSDLQQTGTTFDGSPVYEYKDINTQELKDTYAGIYTPDGQTKLSYNAFIAGHPIFFWQDAFGKFVRFHNKTFLPMAECGKPVIYLYPQQTEKVSVQLAPVGGFSYTEPLYNNGWNVIADPLSNITNLADGKTYPYLFWEGTGGMYQTPTKGFVVAQSGVHALLENKLSLMGLNNKERTDFEEFWEPKMQSSPYYFVTFMGNSVMDQIAPLTIIPKPDTVIRILMDFKSLQHLISVEGFNIHTPQRKGFTVVEWGGVLR
jgi:hypothetical protein